MPNYNIAAMSPPAGVTSNFNHPESRGYQLIITSTVSLALAVFFVSGRVYTKIRRIGLGPWGWDDSVCLLSLAAVAAYITLCIYSLSLGIGEHMWDQDISIFNDRFLVIVLMVQVFYGPVLFIVKFSLFLLYLRVFAPARWLRYLVYFGIVFNFLFYASCATIQSIYCSPYPGSTWNDFILSQLMHSNRCDKIITLSLVQSSVNIVSDIYMLILPIPAVFQLRLQTKQKLGVLSIFATGLLAIIASAMSLAFRTQLNEYGDITWELVQVLTTLIVEMNVGIVCCCMPAFANLIRHHLPAPKMRSKYHGSTAIGSHKSATGGLVKISSPIPLQDDSDDSSESGKFDMKPISNNKVYSHEIPADNIEGGKAPMRLNSISSIRASPVRSDMSPTSPKQPTPNWREAHHKPTRSSGGSSTIMASVEENSNRGSDQTFTRDSNHKPLSSIGSIRPPPAVASPHGEWHSYEDSIQPWYQNSSREEVVSDWPLRRS